LRSRHVARRMTLCLQCAFASQLVLWQQRQARG
jgi:hypothetical protein